MQYIRKGQQEQKYTDSDGEKNVRELKWKMKNDEINVFLYFWIKYNMYNLKKKSETNGLSLNSATGGGMFFFLVVSLDITFTWETCQRINVYMVWLNIKCNYLRCIWIFLADCLCDLSFCLSQKPWVLFQYKAILMEFQCGAVAGRFVVPSTRFDEVILNSILSINQDPSHTISKVWGCKFDYVEAQRKQTNDNVHDDGDGG